MRLRKTFSLAFLEAGDNRIAGSGTGAVLPGERVEGRDRRRHDARDSHMRGVLGIKSLRRRRHQRAAIGQALDNRRCRWDDERSKPRAKILDPRLAEIFPARNRPAKRIRISSTANRVPGLDHGEKGGFENSVRDDRRVRDEAAARRELGTDCDRFGIVRTARTQAENRRSLACSFVTAPNK